MAVKTPPGELKDIDVIFISYVSKPANQKKFFLTKSDFQAPLWEKYVKFLVEKDTEKNPQKLVYGIVYEPGVKDTYGNYASAEEIEKAAHKFLEKYRQIDEEHNYIPGVGTVVESYIAPDDFEVNGEVIKKGSWVLVTRASAEVWEKIQKGEYTGYSMAGTGTVTTEAEPADKVERDFDEQMALDGVMELTYKLEEALRKILSNNGTVEEINTSIEQYKIAVNNQLQNALIKDKELNIKDEEKLRKIAKEEIMKALILSGDHIKETGGQANITKAEYAALKEEIEHLKNYMQKSAQVDFNPQKSEPSFL